jgi:RNA polymerase sigma factor (sigma-70 family)
MDLSVETSRAARMRDSHPEAGVRHTLARADFTGIVERHERELLAFLRGLVSEAELARDLLQDTFYDAWRAVKRGAEPFLAPLSQPDVRRWLFHAAYCRAISARRHGSVLRWESLDRGDPDDYGVSGTLVAFEDQRAEAEALGAALKGLAQEDVACLLLIVVEGCTAAEAAEIMGTSSAAVAKRVSRAGQLSCTGCSRPPGRLPPCCCCRSSPRRSSPAAADSSATLPPAAAL